jgi:predicted AAA+ superfamily ATPase
MLARVLEGALAAFPVVVLTGARQTGKTTLVQRLLPGAGARTFRTLDDFRVLELAQREPDLLLREGDPLTLDEVQRAPELLRAIKRAVDEDRRPGRFLLTGSANLLLMQQVSETLAGRAIYLRLGPLTESEKLGRSSSGVWPALLSATTAEQALIALRAQPLVPRAWTDAAAEGGYPPILHLSLENRTRWFEGYVATYLERDLQQLAAISSLTDFRRLLEISALRLGGLLNRADLARDTAISRPTAHRYLNLLEVSFHLRLLRPFAKARGKRLTKSPKLYLTDTGLAAHLAGSLTASDIATSSAVPPSGAFLENLLLAHMDVMRECLTPKPEIYFYRTSDGAELDFVIEHKRRLLPMEVKSSSRVTPRDLRTLERFLDEYSAPWGLIAYAGTEPYAVSQRVVAVPVGALL